MFLEIKQIKKSFGTGDSQVNVLKGIDLEIEKGEFCVLLGPSGSGKSTLLNIIGGIDGADSGSITIEGEQSGELKKARETALTLLDMGMPAEQIAKAVNLSIETVQNWIAETNS